MEFINFSLLFVLWGALAAFILSCLIIRYICSHSVSRQDVAEIVGMIIDIREENKKMKKKSAARAINKGNKKSKPILRNSPTNLMKQ